MIKDKSNKENKRKKKKKENMKKNKKKDKRYNKQKFNKSKDLILIGKTKFISQYCLICSINRNKSQSPIKL